MTRINVVPVEELENIHLMAEYRELPRIFGLAKNYFHSPNRDDSTIPETYRLGSGHVKFFYNKLLWLSNRQTQLVNELLKRGYNLTYTQSTDLLADCPQEYCCDYKVTDEALLINRERINTRLNEYNHKLKIKSLKKQNE